MYTGQIAHKGRLYPGQHPALIDGETWDAVRDQLGANSQQPSTQGDAAEPSLLAGLLVDSRGERLAIARRQKRPALSLLHLSCADRRGRNGSRARLAARRQGDRRSRDQDPGRRAATRRNWSSGSVSRHTQRPNRKLFGRAAGIAATLKWLTRGTSKDRSRACREGHHR